MRQKELLDLFSTMREKRPLVHHIPNYGTVNDCANITLCAGGAPVMADAPEEVEEMAMARLLYREICRARTDWEQNYTYSNDAARYFAASLLIPAQWIIKAAWRPLITLQQLSEDFQVPDYAMSSRLVQLKKHVKGMQ